VKQRKIVVIGGGTAGLISAITLLKTCANIDVRIVRSSQIGHIMVGEGTVGSTPSFFHDTLGIPRKDFYEQVKPTWKLGVRFLWGKRPYFDYTFTSQLEGQVHPNSKVPLGYYFLKSDWQGLSRISEYMSHNTLPCAQDVTSEKGLPNDAAYHFENDAFVKYLEHYFVQLGGELIDAKVVSAKQSVKGIESVTLDIEQIIEADFFVDASGFRGELIHKQLNEPYTSMHDHLFCDRAIVGGWDRQDNEPIKPYTTAETMDSGWCWQIEHEKIINRGYVHCSAFISEDEAVAEFKAKNPKVTDVRTVPFETRRIRNAWVKNVVAIGNACGFVEPLEATNIQVICSQSKRLADSLNVSFNNDELAANYNRIVELEWLNIRDFLALHYRFNNRLPTPFWDMARELTPLGALQDFVDFYKETGPNSLAYNLLPKVEAFSQEGYLIMLLGMQKPWNGANKLMELGEQDLSVLKLLKRGNVLTSTQGINSESLINKIRKNNWSWK